MNLHPQKQKLTELKIGVKIRSGLKTIITIVVIIITSKGVSKGSAKETVNGTSTVVQNIV